MIYINLLILSLLLSYWYTRKVITDKGVGVASNVLLANFGAVFDFVNTIKIKTE